MKFSKADKELYDRDPSAFWSLVNTNIEFVEGRKKAGARNTLAKHARDLRILEEFETLLNV